MSRVEAECRVATFEETLHVFGAFDLGSIMWVEDDAEAVFGPDLLYHRERCEQLRPLAVLQASGHLVALLSRRSGDHKHTGAGRGEALRLSLYRSKRRVACLRAMEHGGHEAPDQFEPVLRK